MFANFNYQVENDFMSVKQDIQNSENIKFDVNRNIHQIIMLIVNWLTIYFVIQFRGLQGPPPPPHTGPIT